MARSKTEAVIKPADRRTGKERRGMEASAEFLLDVFNQVAQSKTLDQKLATIVDIASGR